jgi:hypothetical protein
MPFRPRLGARKDSVSAELDAMMVSVRRWMRRRLARRLAVAMRDAMTPLA